MNKLTMVLLTLFSTTTMAVPIKGQLELKKPMLITAELPPGCNEGNPDPGCYEPIKDTLQPAIYSVTVNSSRYETLLTIKGASRHSNWRLKVPEGRQIPRTSGTFSWTAGEINQVWGMSGKVVFKEENSQPEVEYRTCQIRRYEDVNIRPIRVDSFISEKLPSDGSFRGI